MRFEIRKAFAVFPGMSAGVLWADGTPAAFYNQPVNSELVGTWTSKPNTTLRWLSERHPDTVYFIRPVGPGSGMFSELA